MNLKRMKYNATTSGLKLAAYYLKHDNPRGIIHIVHGMSEHKDRYLSLMNTLYKEGYNVVIYDHRGHGESVKAKEHLGYFYDEGGVGIVDDLIHTIKTNRLEYPHLPYYVIAHSMGTLVARCLLQENDDLINGLILSGPPADDKLKDLGILASKVLGKISKPYAPSRILDFMTFNAYPRAFKEPSNFNWLNSDFKEVRKYEVDEYSGFIFSVNGFNNLFNLLKRTYNLKAYHCKNPNLPIYLLAGSDDMVIKGEKGFKHEISCLKEVGYTDVQAKLYQGLRHEIFLEKERLKVYQDVINIIEAWNI